jgi:hypothetical protein
MWDTSRTRVRGVIARRNRSTRSAGEGDGAYDDAFPPLALAQRGQRARIVLIGGEHLVARPQVEPEQHGLQRFARVAGDRDLLRAYAQERGHAPAHGLDLRLEHRPHGVGGRLVGARLVAPQCVLDDPR